MKTSELFSKKKCLPIRLHGQYLLQNSNQSIHYVLSKHFIPTLGIPTCLDQT